MCRILRTYLLAFIFLCFYLTFKTFRFVIFNINIYFFDFFDGLVRFLLLLLLLGFNFILLFFFFFFAIVLCVSWWFFQQRIISMVEVFGFPVLPYKSPCLKIASNSLMFLFPLNLYFNSLSSAAPFFHHLLVLLFPSFFSYFSVLVLKPNLLYFLLLHIISWIVAHEIRSSFEPILSLEEHRITCAVKLLKRMWYHRSFVIFELGLSLSTSFSNTQRGHTT